MKKKAILISAAGVVVVVLLVLLVVNIFDNSDLKSELKDYILENREDLEAYVGDLIASKTDDSRDTFDGITVDYWKRNKMVEFSKTGWGAGIVPASTYRGFYYSPDDKPLGFQGTSLSYVEDGAGWKSKDYPGSSIREYTERLADHWFWYEVKF
ncbi:MAG: hypothetical protein K6E95_07585 [Lachnospiraceae bacterium]|nr:hypothetical protein [Lachnospiraceae bacterium]